MRQRESTEGKDDKKRNKMEQEVTTNPEKRAESLDWAIKLNSGKLSLNRQVYGRIKKEIQRYKQ